MGSSEEQLTQQLAYQLTEQIVETGDVSVSCNSSLIEVCIPDDMLCKIFLMLYGVLPFFSTRGLKDTNRVNRRWFHLFKHPLMCFKKGRFTHTLNQFPPTYYVDRGEDWKRFVKAISDAEIIESHLERIEENDTKYAEFLLETMFLFPFQTDVHCNNKTVSKLLGSLYFKRDRSELLGEMEWGRNDDIRKAKKKKGNSNNNRPRRDICKHYRPQTDLIQVAGLFLLSSTALVRAIVYNGGSWAPFKELLRDEEFAKLAIREQPSVLKRVSEWGYCNEVSQELCRLALQQSIHNRSKRQQTDDESIDLSMIPYELITTDICELAYQQIGIKAKDFLNWINFAPKNMVTYDRWLTLVRDYGGRLNVVPEYQRTEELCAMAIQSDSRSIIYCPEEKVTEEMCRIAIKSHPETLSLLPKRFITEEMCLMAIQSDSRSIIYCPEEKVTEEMCRTAIKSHPETLSLLPKRFITEEMCLFAVQNNKCALQFVPNEFKTKEICRIAISKNAFQLLYILPNSDPVETDELSKLAIHQSPEVLKLLPKNKITKEMLLLARARNKELLVKK